MKIAGKEVGLTKPFFLIAGPCVIESREFALETAEQLRDIAKELDIPFVYKSSFDKANRTSGGSFRGMGMDTGLSILSEVRDTLDLEVLTDVHNAHDVPAVSQAVDVLQTPAFLCRQTDLIEAIGACGKRANIKKGQFLSPPEMKHVVEKANNAGGKGNITVCERGASFGYNNLVVDMRSLGMMQSTGCPVVFDATHSVQLPGAGDGKSGGQREFIPLLARAAIAAGVSGLFMETHPDPANAKSDGPNAWPLHKMRDLLRELKQIDEVVKRGRFLNLNA